MRSVVVALLFAVAGICAISAAESDVTEEEKRARDFLEKLNEKTLKRYNRIALANWAHAANLTDANLQLKVGAVLSKLCFIFLVLAAKCKCGSRQGSERRLGGGDKVPMAALQRLRPTKAVPEVLDSGNARVVRREIQEAEDLNQRHAENLLDGKDLRLQEQDQMRPQFGTRYKLRSG